MSNLESTTVVFTSKKMIRFILPFAFVIIQICSAAEWGDSGVKLNTKQVVVIKIKIRTKGTFKTVLVK